MTVNLKQLLALAKPVQPRAGFPRESKVHPEMADDFDAMMDADREYFDLHPFAKSYYRKPYQNELSYFAALHPHSKQPLKIQVQRTDAPGVRIRQPIFEDSLVHGIVMDQER